MAKFTIHSRKADGSIVWMQYDNQTSDLTDPMGKRIVSRLDVVARSSAPAVSRATPLGKTSPRVLKISLGLSCNYECEYCSQRFVPRADETNPGDVDAFISGLDSWVTTPPEAVEFWGGEQIGRAHV